MRIKNFPYSLQTSILTIAKQVDKKKVLLLSANPSNTYRLSVEAEFREIEECCQKPSLRDR
ncbi:MAG: hypothetical protein IM539_11410 [Pseudanabaena sp. M046S1SP1A06QC]|nr:hypothetical protein [Pseudanabaena sp. M046S1SP1A06QC]